MPLGCNDTVFFYPALSHRRLWIGLPNQRPSDAAGCLVSSEPGQHPPSLYGLGGNPAAVTYFMISDLNQLSNRLLINVC